MTTPDADMLGELLPKGTSERPPLLAESVGNGERSSRRWMRTIVTMWVLEEMRQRRLRYAVVSASDSFRGNILCDLGFYAVRKDQ